MGIGDMLQAQIDAEDAVRYRFLRAVAMQGGLEALIALGQADFIFDPKKFDAWVDSKRSAERTGAPHE